MSGGLVRGMFLHQTALLLLLSSLTLAGCFLAMFWAHRCPLSRTLADCRVLSKSNTMTQLIKLAERTLTLLQPVLVEYGGAGRCSKQGDIHLPVPEVALPSGCSEDRVSMVRFQPSFSASLSCCPGASFPQHCPRHDSQFSLFLFLLTCCNRSILHGLGSI